jgi:hypothetical protein
MPPTEFDAASSRPEREASHDLAAPPTPDAILPPLDADQVRALQEVGREWGPASDRRAAPLPVDPSLSRHPELPQPTRWGRLVHVKPQGGATDELEATRDDDAGSDLATVAHRIRRAVLGPPLKSSAIVQERMRKLVALPVLSADALSSVAYGPQAMLAGKIRDEELREGFLSAPRVRRVLARTN